MSLSNICIWNLMSLQKISFFPLFSLTSVTAAEYWENVTSRKQSKAHLVQGKTSAASIHSLMYCYMQLEHFVPSSGFILNLIPIDDDSNLMNTT